MKAVALALVLANLAFFAWWRWLRPVELPVHSPPPAEIPTLTLATEAKAEAPKTPVSAAADTGHSEESTAPAEVPAGDAQNAAPVQVANASAAAPSQSQPANTARCISLGPFHELPAATQAAASLRERGYAPRTRAEEGDVWAGLWVHLENIRTRADAQRIMSVLKQNAITDAYLMPTAAGETLDISLGIFSEPARAQRRAADVRSLGFSPTIADRTRKGTLYWLNMDLKPADLSPNPADLHPEDGRIVRLEIHPCPAASVASAG